MMRTAVRRASGKRIRSSAALGAWEGVVVFFLLAILTRIQLLGDASPFPAACFTAGLFVGMPVTPMLLGCLMGSRFETLGAYALMPFASLLIALFLYVAYKSLPAKKRAKGSAGKTRFASEDIVCLSIAGFSTFLASLIFSAITGADVFVPVMSALIAMLIAPVMTTALSVRLQRRTLLRDEQMALMMLFLQVLLGARSIPYAGEQLAPLIAAALTLVAGGKSAGTGAMVGILTGTVLILQGDDPFIATSLSLCGLLAGLVRRMGRPASALAFMAGNTVTMVYGMSYTVSALHPLLAAGLCGLYLICPRAVVERLWAFMSEVTDIPDANKLIHHVRESAEARVRAVSMVFDELTRGYQMGATPPPDEQMLIGQMRKKLCADCARYEQCWQGESKRAHRLFGGLLMDALTASPITAQSELPPEMVRHCARSANIARKLSPLLNEFQRQKRAAAARTEAREMSARQLEQAGQILRRLADKLTRPIEIDSDTTHLMNAVLDREGLCADEILALKSAAPEVIVKLKDELWTREAILAVEKRLSRELGVTIRSTYKSGVYENMIGFIEAPRFAAHVGMAGRPMDVGTLSGDNCAAANLPDGMVMLALSDGMGHGEQAARESAQAIRLLKRFLAADVKRELALDLINGLLNMLSNDEMYATVDLLVIDLKSGQAEINKLGACHTTLLRGSAIAHIEGGRLPLGILEKVKPTANTVALEHGDLLVMVSDGVADSAVDEDRAFLDSLIRKHRRLDPQSLCTEILNAATTRYGTQKDDMTVMAIKLEEESLSKEI